MQGQKKEEHALNIPIQRRVEEDMNTNLKEEEELVEISEEEVEAGVGNLSTKPLSNATIARN
jgi:hypothetical protein